MKKIKIIYVLVIGFIVLYCFLLTFVSCSSVRDEGALYGLGMGSPISQSRAIPPKKVEKSEKEPLKNHRDAWKKPPKSPSNAWEKSSKGPGYTWKKPPKSPSNAWGKSSKLLSTYTLEKPPKDLRFACEIILKNRLDTIDQIIEQLEFGNIAFNVPKTMNLYETAVIQLMLSLKIPIDELKRMIEIAGAKDGARIRVSDRMEARLSGPNFAITAITPEIQAVSGRNITEWKWEVKPSIEGLQYLHLTLSVLLSVDGSSTPRAIRTFDKVIEVEATWHQQVSSFFEKNWQWLWAAILVPIVCWLWKKKKKSKPKVSQSNRKTPRSSKRKQPHG